MIAKLVAWWTAIPPTTREPIKSYAVALCFGGGVVVGTLFSAYFTDHPANSPAAWGGFFWYLLSPHALGGIVAGAIAFYRAHQGLQAAKTVVIEPPNPMPQTLKGP